MVDYWFVSYGEQCEYHDICTRIERLLIDLRDNFDNYSQNHLRKMIIELDDLKEQKQSMQKHGLQIKKFYNNYPISEH